jgi:signal transduction histidine kinase
LIVASVLWTAGLLMLMHMASLLLIHAFPRMLSKQHTAPFVIAFTLLAAGLLSARQSLRPFRHLREKLMAVRIGEQRRVDGVYPTEVQPLIDDLNALLEDREKAVKRAFATAGDLAHGLKTPLALLAQEADRAASDGSTELAGNIAHHVDRMSRQVNYQLARARAAASGSAGARRCLIAPCVDALVRTLLKLHAGRAIDISTTVPPDALARVHREDFDEMLGNLLDNACKWTHSKVVIEASQVSGMLVLTIDDDGPGLDQGLRSAVLERGVRADEAAPGSGLGLAIVRDLSESYGGSIALDDSPLGGLRARLSLPQ